MVAVAARISLADAARFRWNMAMNWRRQISALIAIGTCTAAAHGVVLYDGALGTTPADQGLLYTSPFYGIPGTAGRFLYQAYLMRFPFPRLPEMNDHGGYHAVLFH